MGDTSKEMATNIKQVRNSVCGLLRVHHVSGNQYNVAIVGTAWCVIRNHYFVTAYHVLNNGQARNQNDKFFILRAPENGPKLERTPVVAFTFEDQACDYAILEINRQEGATLVFDALTIYTGQVEDGTKVLTYGYPSPKVSRAGINKQGQLIGINTVLLSHGNEGIVASQYAQGQYHMYELNVGWHHGESGGPILILNPPRVLAIMQRYKNISTPHGTVAGPHLGVSIEAISSQIANLS
ncbi:hypothetical protein ES703_96488 [subsurface metagenome]